MKKPTIHRVADSGVIEIRGARQNNLKGLDLDLPLGKLNVITGPSGSGKSSLAFDTLYAEGQRRYVETFSPYTRQFLERMDKPKVDEIRGIPPAIAIEQANPVKTTRSTVGTITEINDYLKLLLPRVVQAFCPGCQREIRPETVGSIVAALFVEAPERPVLAGETVLVSFVVPVPPKTAPSEFFEFLQQQGYLRVQIDGQLLRTDAPCPLRELPAVVRVIQDRVRVTQENRSRLTESVETALRFGKGKVAFLLADVAVPFSTGWHCAHCDVDIPAPSAGLFSFNHPIGACPTCRGFGRTITIDLDRAIPDRSLSLAQGAIKPFQTENGAECQRDLLRSAAARKLDVKTPFAQLSEADQRWVFLGERPGESGEALWKEGLWYGVKGFFDWLESKAYKMHVRVLLSRYRTYTQCAACHGGRFQPATLHFRVGGKTLPELMALSIGDLAGVLNGEPVLQAASDATTALLLGEVRSRLGFLLEVGLDYLSLERPTRTLSGGEIERVNLTTCLGASLVNTLFVLDEPSVGLHPRDTGRLIGVLKGLRDKGNTLLVVEHEEAVIRAADHIIEIGPGRGDAGGSLVYNGPLDGLLRHSAKKTPRTAGAQPSDSLTADYLTGRKSIPVPGCRRSPRGFISVKGASEHNLREIDVDFPLGVFACISGVSGSGKSTLVHEVLFKNLQAAKGLPTEDGVGRCRAVLGHEAVDQVVMVDQSPLSRTPRSSPAVYLGVFDAIRELFACTPDALARGLTASAFSFNSGTGRCERCSGSGFEKIEMQFLSDVFVRCPECDGKRYQPELLELLLGGEPGVGKSIHDVLSMTVSEAIGFFTRLGAVKVVGPLSVLEEVGLGYLTLGQPLNVLSGGESQRLKLVERLTRRGEGPALLIFDEPTTGLHFDDVALLIRALNRLVDAGHSLLVIEHNLEVIKCADYLVDLGPDAGVRGGEVVAVGTPEEVAQNEESHTGRFLRPLLLGVASDKAAAGLRAAEQPAVPVSGRRDRDNAIQIFGAREHNLKNFNLRIPRNEMVIITGLSGSGKSTLAFDLLFAEGQRRFLDSMSAYARQFVEQLEKPEVDLITGLPPSVAIEQRITRGGGKSTVATVTEVYHFLRLLFAKLGVQYCPRCDLPVQKQGLSAIVRQAEALARKGPLRVLAPLVKARKGFHTDVAKWAVRHGFKELLVDGFWVRADRFEKLERFQEHTIEVLIGISGEEEPVGPLVQRALEVGKGTARILEARSARATARAVTSGEGVVVSLDRSCPGCGESFEELDPRLFSFNSPHGWCVQCHGFGEVWKATVNPRLETAVELELDEERQHEALEDGEAEPCPGCRGTRLNEGARAVRLGGHTLPEITAWSAGQAQAWVSNLKFTGAQAPVAADILPEIRQRLQFMGEVGLDYLTLARSAKTLSGGESQRIRLAAQLGSNLQGVLYVLDEPTIGLHPRDNEQLLDTLEALKAKGNSLIIVEHDEETMRRADSIIDLGPGAGSRGGQVVAHGTLAQILENPGSATGRCLREPLQHPTRGSRRALNEVSHWLEVQNACLNNLKDVRVRLPLGRLNVITGISGSGKSTLMRGVLKPAVDACLKKGGVPAAGKRKPSKPRGRTLPWGKVTGAEHIEAVYEVDQSPIGKTSRSTPATYIKVFDEIRKLYAQVPLARMRGYSASRFSFNSEGGRCETCAGQGMIKIEMNFLPTSYAPCHECGGRRYHSATLEVLYNERSIGDVMEMTLDQAVEFFKASPKIQRPLALLCDTGLGYLKLGQPSPTLSGGEAQRLKLASELTRGLGRTQNARLRGKGAAKSMLYLLEEPTIGLHMADVCELLKVLHRLVDDGQTVVVIEHNLSLIAEADYLLDVGPEAGAEGGRIVAEGTPEQVAQSAESRTAPFLRETLQLPDPGRKRSRGLRAE